MESKIAVARLSALAHEGRLAVFRLLVKAGVMGMPAGDISRRLDVRPSTLSTSLNILVHAQLIRARRQGRSIIYTADYDRMRDLLGFLVEDCCGGSPEICAPLADVMRAACCQPDSAIEETP